MKLKVSEKTDQKDVSRKHFIVTNTDAPSRKSVPVDSFKTGGSFLRFVKTTKWEYQLMDKGRSTNPRQIGGDGRNY